MTHTTGFLQISQPQERVCPVCGRCPHCGQIAQPYYTPPPAVPMQPETTGITPSWPYQGPQTTYYTTGQADSRSED
jgi:hypothetical protein